jgi:hypothetical protein
MHFKDALIYTLGYTSLQLHCSLGVPLTQLEFVPINYGL